MVGGELCLIECDVGGRKLDIGEGRANVGHKDPHVLLEGCRGSQLASLSPIKNLELKSG